MPAEDFYIKVTVTPGRHCPHVYLATNLYAFLWKEGDVFGDEGVIEGVEVESGEDLLAVIEGTGPIREWFGG